VSKYDSFTCLSPKTPSQHITDGIKSEHMAPKVLVENGTVLQRRVHHVLVGKGQTEVKRGEVHIAV